MSEIFSAEKNRSLSLVKWTTLLFVPLAVFLWVSTATNESLFLLLNSRLVDWLGSPIWGLLTCMGDGCFLFPLGMLLAWKNPAKQQTMIITIILAALALNLSKYAIDASRPLKVLGEGAVTVVGPYVRHCTMPSGHTGTIAVLAGLAILFSGRRAALAAITLAILTGVSRIAVGAHWPADVAAGAWVGLICAVLGVIISARINTGFKVRCFYIFLGFIPAFLLPVYHNGFQGIALVYYSQYVLAAVSLVLALLELKTLIGDYETQRNNNA